MISSHLIVNISTGCLSDCWLRTSILCGLPKRHCGKESACQCRRCKRRGFDFWVEKIPWSRKWQPTPVFLLGNSAERGAWRATVHEVIKSQTQLSNSIHTRTCSLEQVITCWEFFGHLIGDETEQKERN